MTTIIETKIHEGQLLRVYELEGPRRLPDPPARGLAGVWPEPPYYYLFYTEDALDAVQQWLQANPHWRLVSRYCLPYENWQDISNKPFSIGPFRIGASTGASTENAHTDGITIKIDPGIVFGSGLHPTTQGCLLAVSELFASKKIGTAVDFGTGTGVLAIACALLGARSVLAVDCIPAALAVARQNARTNAVADHIGFVTADSLAVLNSPFDLLLMNIEWPIMEGVLGGHEWKGYRDLVLSGFLESMLNRVEEKVSPWFRRTGMSIIEGWSTLTLTLRQKVKGKR